ncbi:sentrin-specific protease 7 isoform X3 [Gasterosteus aculeatus]
MLPKWHRSACEVSFSPTKCVSKVFARFPMGAFENPGGLRCPYILCWCREKPRPRCSCCVLTKSWTMMEQRRALTIPLNVDHDKRVENPLKISMPRLSSHCGKSERQVSWTAFAGCKRRHGSSEQINGSERLDQKSKALEIVRRKPCLILTDVLETEPGKAYMERIKRGRALGSRMLHSGRESGRSEKEPLVRRDVRCRWSESRNDESKSVAPKCNQSTTSSPLHRSTLKRKSQNGDDEVDIEEDIEELVTGEDRDDLTFTDVVDCGLSVSWEPAVDAGRCDDFIKDRLTDPEKEMEHSAQKRKKKDAGSQVNGTGSHNHHRESVLRLTGEDGRDGGQDPACVYLEGSEEDADLENLGRSIVQSRVGVKDPAEVLVPTELEAGESLGSPGRSPSSSQDHTTATSPPEPIVLSSDDEEGADLASGAVIQGRCPQDVVADQLEASDVEDIQVFPGVANLSGSTKDSIPSMGFSFSTLYCGGYQVKANGDFMIADQQITIPLTAVEGAEVTLTVDRKDLRRYSVWEQQDLEDRGLRFEDDEQPSPAAILFCVSESAAAAVHRELLERCVPQNRNKSSGPFSEVSPFILLTLKYPVEGVEGALLRSLLDIDCLNSLTHEQSTGNLDACSCLKGFHTPVLSLDDSVELIRRTGLGSHLLSLLGLQTADSRPGSDQDGPHSDTDNDGAAHIQLQVETQAQTELEREAEKDPKTQLKPDQVQEKPVEPRPIYTLCHRRTKGSFSVSMCKPRSSLIKFKHQGLARRLIQFPPPPLKGGITVTMEDLRCLDCGHFLNDVIIDFYLKYLLQNASAALGERCHIFSSFFYKQLTRRDNASEGVTSDSDQRQKRHQRVKTWTRHVDIFEKDFLFVPVNQEAHWYLVLICFPGLDEAKSETWSGPDGESRDREAARGSESPNDSQQTPGTSIHEDGLDTETEKPSDDSTKEPSPGPVSCTEQTCQKRSVSKRPCILIMDSLKLSLHERVFKLLRDYLQAEWEVRRGSTRDFSPDQMQSSHCKVPLQDNSSDCGLYLLQYVESFLKDPVVHFDLPLHLQKWFPRQQVRRKRDEIRDLVLYLHRNQNHGSDR